MDFAFGWWDKFGIPAHGKLNHPGLRNESGGGMKKKPPR